MAREVSESRLGIYNWGRVRRHDRGLPLRRCDRGPWCEPVNHGMSYREDLDSPIVEFRCLLIGSPLVARFIVIGLVVENET